ncbi:MAG: hypothetical protein BWY82_01553 [Verrucomicrobia bacterium ADurb.Bin474]|nr:MAG: hypothetical protein BWY82_01553 [Verrucomicrobia bacterium ADurb.Bin474]
MGFAESGRAHQSCTFVLARIGRLWNQGRDIPIARLVAIGTCECAQPCIGDHVRGLHQNGHLRPASLQPMDADSDRGRMGNPNPRSREFHFRSCLCTWPTRPQASTGLSQCREYRYYPHRSRFCAYRKISRPCGMGTTRDGRRPASRLESRTLQGSAIPWSGVRHSFLQDPDHEPDGWPLEKDAGNNHMFRAWRSRHFRTAPT